MHANSETLYISYRLENGVSHPYICFENYLDGAQCCGVRGCEMKGEIDFFGKSVRNWVSTGKIPLSSNRFTENQASGPSESLG